MNRREAMERLGRALAFGETDALIECMCDDCKYHSDYAQKHIRSAKRIGESMKRVDNFIRENQSRGIDCTYSYKITALSDIFRSGVSLDDLRQGAKQEVGEYGLLLYQYDAEKPAAIVFAHFTPEDRMAEITLSRKRKWFDVRFSGDDGLEDFDIDRDILYTAEHESRAEEREPAEADDRNDLRIRLKGNEYYVRREAMDRAWKFLYAVNYEDLDVLELLVEHAFVSYAGPDILTIGNRGVYEELHRVRAKYDEMRLGFIRRGDDFCDPAPYLEEYGYFTFGLGDAGGRISCIAEHDFDETEFIKTNAVPYNDTFACVPDPISAAALLPTDNERFALKITYDNGECRKYVLPLEAGQETDEVAEYEEHVFTDAIWRSAKIRARHSDTSAAIPHRRPAIGFKNGYCISALTCYEQGTAYSEPKMLNRTIYEDAARKITLLWEWNAESLREDRNTGLLRVQLSSTTDRHGKYTFAAKSEVQPGIPDFDYAGDFHDGLSLVQIRGKGCGYIDRNMNLVIPMKYDRAYAFRNGRATMELNGIWYTADTAGNLTEIRPGPHSSQYRCFGDYSEELCKASTRFEPENMTYQSESADFAGCWGFVDESGREVIPPQYIYAYNFKDGTAFVCKGELIIDEKADDRHGREKYRAEGEKWGAIDREGNEVVPFIFDDIDFFLDTKDVLMACIGTGEDERWGVIDRRENWLAEPMFEEIYQEYQDGLFAFWGLDKWHANYRALGIYDIRQHRIAFEPQFSDVTFTEDGWIEVSAYDKELDDYADKLIDINGNEKFSSAYTYIAAGRKPYEVSIWTESEDRHGLIDENGNVVLPCKYHTNWRGIYYEQQRLVFNEAGNQGVMDFNDNVIIPAVYHEISDIEKPFYTVRVGTDEQYKEGLITPSGETVLPAEYESVRWCRDDHIIASAPGRCRLLRSEPK